MKIDRHVIAIEYYIVYDERQPLIGDGHKAIHSVPKGFKLTGYRWDTPLVGYIYTRDTTQLVDKDAP